METHTYVMVTTVPRSAFLPNYPAVLQDYTIDSPEISPHELLVPAFPRPRAKVLAGSKSPVKTLRSLPKASVSDTTPSTADVTPTEEITQLDLPGPAKDIFRSNRPIYFNRDGTVSGKSHVLQGTDQQGKSLDVHELLRTTDWSKTGLGPMSQWPQSIKTAGEYGSCSIANDSIPRHASKLLILSADRV